jgi:ribosomal protein S3
MTTTYMFNKTNRTNIMSMQRQALSIIKSFFAKYQSLVGKPVISVSPDKVIVQLFYYAPTEILTNASIAALGDALTRCFGRTVELRLVRINHSALDSSIFAQYLTANGGKYSFNRILDMLKGSLPTVVSEGSVDENSDTPTSAHITGVKIKLSGRLTTQRSGPRQTVQAGRLGSSAKGQFGTVDYSQHTAKNKLGAFTMKVWISQQSR